MIVKTIEQMQDYFGNFHVIHSLRLYKEKTKASIQLHKTQSELSKMAFGNDNLQRLASLFTNKDQSNVGPCLDVSSNPSRYELVEKIIVSDSGPLNKNLDKHQRGKNL